MKLKTLFEYEYDPRQAANCTAMAAAFNTFGFLLLLAFERNERFPIWPPLISAGFGAAVLMLAGIFGRRPARKAVEWTFIANAFSVTAALVIINNFYIYNVPYWIPFQTTHLAVLYVAMVAPSYRTGLLGIVIHSSATLIQFYGIPAQALSRFPPGEPVATIAFSVAAVFILTLRYRALILQLEYQHALSAANVSKALADRSLHIRDLMNSPLQVLRSSIDLLQNDLPEDVRGRCERAVDQLNSLNALLAKDERPEPCNPSFDARAALKPR